MANTDDIVSNLPKALELPEGALITGACVVVEYLNPDGDGKSLGYVSSEDLPPWTAAGMLSYAAEIEGSLLSFSYYSDDEYED